MEIATDDPDELKGKCRAFGLKSARHAYTPFEYIQAPGGQVLRILQQKTWRIGRADGLEVAAKPANRQPTNVAVAWSLKPALRVRRAILSDWL